MTGPAAERSEGAQEGLAELIGRVSGGSEMTIDEIRLACLRIALSEASGRDDQTLRRRVDALQVIVRPPRRRSRKARGR